MSICRWSPNCEVYLFTLVDGTFECCGCLLGGRHSFASREATLGHIQDHIAAGHKVPEYVISTLTVKTKKTKKKTK